MQQSLLALVAMLVATLLTFSQMQARTQSQQQAVRTEVQQMALGVAMQAMEVVRARAFDAATVNSRPGKTVEKTELTDTPFSTGKDCKAFGGTDTCNDVDDFHDMVPATIPFSLADGEFDFTVEVRVRYVDSALSPTGGTPSYQKEVTVYVQDAPSGRDPRLPTPIEYSEVIAYP